MKKLFVYTLVATAMIASGVLTGAAPASEADKADVYFTPADSGAILSVTYVDAETPEEVAPKALEKNDNDELKSQKAKTHAAAEIQRAESELEEMLSRAEYLGVYWVTGYDLWCPHCQGKWVGVTASGIEPEVGRTIAMCDQFSFGTQIYIEGLGFYVVEDRGVGAGQIDVACNNHDECYALTGHYKVWVIDNA